MLITGTTQLSGKTTLLKALARQAVEQGYKVLIFDCKQNLADFENFGEEIPICMRETTDSLTILGLLESIMGRKLTVQYATLSRVTQGAKTFKDVLSNAEELEKTAKNGFVKDCARVLMELLSRLIEQTAERETSPKLELKHPINRISMNKFALEGQQMIVKTAFEDALEHPKLIVILDEASKFNPQKYRSACQRAISHYVTQGAITNNYLWMATQYLATTSKDAMKAMDIKLLGRQSHDTECEHTLDLIPKLGAVKFTNDSIMQLKLGHFIAVAENWVKIVYSCPENADKSESLEVALGKRQPEKIHYHYMLTTEQAQKLLKKEKTESPPSQVTIDIPDEVEEETEQTIMTVEIPTVVSKEPSEEPEKKKKEKTDGRTEFIVPTYKERRKPSFTGKPLGGVLGERIELLESNIEGLRQRIMKIEAIPQVACSGSQDVSLGQLHTEITIKKTVKQVTLTDENIRGRILMLAKEGFLDAYHPLRDIISALEGHHWTVNPNSVKMELYKMVKAGLLGSRVDGDKNNEYVLSPNVEFKEFGT